MAPEWPDHVQKWSANARFFSVTFDRVRFAMAGRDWITSVLVCIAQVAGCSGTRGSLVVSERIGDASLTADGSAPGEDAQVPDAIWRPAADATFQLQLTGKLDTSVNAEVYIIDLDSPAADFTALRKAGRRIVCHFSAGTVETFREDAADIPETAWGPTLEAYPDERWLDVTFAGVREVMGARLERAVEHGCSAVLPENLSVHLVDSGFATTPASAIAYSRFLATQAAARGLGAMLSADAMIDALAAEYTMGLAFNCLSEDACGRWAPLRKAGKAVMGVEVGDADSAEAVCASARAQGLNTIVKHANFDAFRIACP